MSGKAWMPRKDHGTGRNRHIFCNNVFVDRTVKRKLKVHSGNGTRRFTQSSIFFSIQIEITPETHRDSGGNAHRVLVRPYKGRLFKKTATYKQMKKYCHTWGKAGWQPRPVAAVAPQDSDSQVMRFVYLSLSILFWLKNDDIAWSILDQLADLFKNQLCPQRKCLLLFFSQRNCS